jgi:long-chain acyl-CoA synthetase
MVEKWRATFCVAAITAYIALMERPGCRFSGLLVDDQVLLGWGTRRAWGRGSIPGEAGRADPQYLWAHREQLAFARDAAWDAGPVDPASGALAIGVAIPNLDARIVDLADPSRELPPGEAGELAMRGPMMFPGYWNKPEATAAAFHDGWFPYR